MNSAFKRVESIVPNTTKISAGLVIERGVKISSYVTSIGRHVYIASDSDLKFCESIGNFSCIGPGCKVGIANHLLTNVSTHPLFYDKNKKWISSEDKQFEDNTMVTIGNDVLLSANVMVLKGVKIGDGAVVAAGSFVNKDVPPYAIVGGIPAKVIRHRFDDVTIEKLIASKWWNLDDEHLRQYSSYFQRPAEFTDVIRQKK